MAHEVRGLGAQLVILAAEGNDAVGGIESGQPANAVAVQAGAVDEEIAGEFAGWRSAVQPSDVSRKSRDSPRG